MPHLTEEESEAPKRELSASPFSGPAKGSRTPPCPQCLQARGADNHDQLFHITSDPQELYCVYKSILLPCLEMLCNTVAVDVAVSIPCASHVFPAWSSSPGTASGALTHAPQNHFLWLAGTGAMGQ